MGEGRQCPQTRRISPRQSRGKRRRRGFEKDRWRSILEDAAARTLQGDGCDPCLPPLPIRPGVRLSGEPHPFGVLPFGNRLLFRSSDNEEDDDDCRKSLGSSSFGRLNDSQVLHTLEFLDGVDLGRLVCTCRFFYVFGHVEELWRDLLLRRNNKNSSAGGGVVTRFRMNWKVTYVSETLKKTPTSIPDSYGALPYDYRPISIQGLYSDVLYRSYLCGTFDVDPDQIFSAQNVVEVPRLDNRSLKPSKFVEEHEAKNVPCVLTNVTSSWDAYQRRWNDPSYFVDGCVHRDDDIDDDVSFRATSGGANESASFTLRAYADYCCRRQTCCASSESDSSVIPAPPEEAQLYLFDRTFVEKAPRILEDYEKDLHTSCSFFDPRGDYAHDLFGLLGNERRPDFRWIIMGPKRSGSAFHIDPNATHAWNAPLSPNCRKYWIFYPPGVTPPGIHPSENGDDVAMPISLGEWFLTYWDAHVERRSSSLPSSRPMECVVEPGQILFVPHGWWHLVVNLGEGCNVALTQNYVSERNLSDVLRFLRYNVQQVSGCRDRPGEAVSADQLYDEFRKVLLAKDKDLWMKAKTKAGKGWTCNAWKGGDHDDDNDEKKQEDVIPPLSTIKENRDGVVFKPSNLFGLPCSSENGKKPFTFSFL